MPLLALVVAPLLILVTLLDGFETILLPRRINRRFRYSRLYYRGTWFVWRAAARALPAGRWREAMLGAFGPLSMLGLFASWVTSLIVAFGLLHWAIAPLTPRNAGLPINLYFSGTTFFTLGLGDVTPANGPARALTVVEAGLGFGFLAVIIGYLPVLYQAFSRREVTITLLDARAGSPPAGGEALLRLARDGGRAAAVNAMLREWEQWAAELLESHISFPVLAYYRSQHANQSWLAALATMLDACALLLTAGPAAADSSHQAQLTFAMARHAAVDLALVFGIQPGPPTADRLPAGARQALRAALAENNPPPAPADSAALDDRLTAIRGMYEPFLDALAAHFLLSLPPIAGGSTADNWQRSAYMPRTPGIGSLPAASAGRDHFD
jgi:hypothetical protein